MINHLPNTIMINQKYIIVGMMKKSHRDKKEKPRERSLSPHDHGEYRYQDPYLTKKKEDSIINQ